MCRKIRHAISAGKRISSSFFRLTLRRGLSEAAEGDQLARTEAQKAEDIIDSVTAGICVFRMPDADHSRGSL